MKTLEGNLNAGQSVLKRGKEIENEEKDVNIFSIEYRLSYAAKEQRQYNHSVNTKLPMC